MATGKYNETEVSLATLWYTVGVAKRRFTITVLYTVAKVAKNMRASSFVDAQAGNRGQIDYVP